MLYSVSEMTEDETSSERSWCLLGRSVPRSEIVFFCQIILLYTVVITSIYNLTVTKEPSTLWTSLLSSSLGYLLPNPTIDKRRSG